MGTSGRRLVSLRPFRPRPSACRVASYFRERRATAAVAMSSADARRTGTVFRPKKASYAPAGFQNDHVDVTVPPKKVPASSSGADGDSKAADNQGLAVLTGQCSNSPSPPLFSPSLSQPRCTPSSSEPSSPHHQGLPHHQEHAMPGGAVCGALTQGRVDGSSGAAQRSVGGPCGCWLLSWPCGWR